MNPNSEEAFEQALKMLDHMASPHYVGGVYAELAKEGLKIAHKAAITAAELALLEKLRQPIQGDTGWHRSEIITFIDQILANRKGKCNHDPKLSHAECDTGEIYCQCGELLSGTSYARAAIDFHTNYFKNKKGEVDEYSNM